MFKNRTAGVVLAAVGSAAVSMVLFCVQGFTSVLMLLGALAPAVSADMTISARPMPSPIVAAAWVAGIASLLLAFVSYGYARRHDGRGSAQAMAIAVGGAVMWGSSLGLGLLLEKAPGANDWWWLGFLPTSENVFESAMVMVLPMLVAAAALWAGSVRRHAYG